MAGEASNPSQIIEVSEREWQAMTPTIKAKTLWSDPATKRRMQLTRFEPGAKLPLHRHAGDEFLYVIEGEITDESGTVAAGSVGYRPDGCTHTVTSKNGATVFAIISGGVESATEIGSGPRFADDRPQRASVAGRDTRRPPEGHLERPGDQAARAAGAFRGGRQATPPQA